MRSGPTPYRTRRAVKASQGSYTGSRNSQIPNLPQEKLASLYERYPRCLQAVKDAREPPTRY